MKVGASYMLERSTYLAFLLNVESVKWNFEGLGFLIWYVVMRIGSPLRLGQRNSVVRVVGIRFIARGLRQKLMLFKSFLLSHFLFQCLVLGQTLN